MKTTKQTDTQDSRDLAGEQTAQGPRRALILRRESIRILSDDSLRQVAGGWRITISRNSDCD